MAFSWYGSKFQAWLNRMNLFENLVVESFGRSMIVFQPLKSSRSFDVREVFKLTTLQKEALTQVLWSRIISRADSNDDKVIKIANFVNRHIHYEYDDKNPNYLRPEYWADAHTVYRLQVDDCDGYAVLIMKFMELAGIPEWRRRVVAGRVKSGEGHAYVAYFTQKNNIWCAVEGSYFPQKALAAFNRVSLINNHNYLEVWWSTTEKRSWARGKQVFANLIDN